MHDCLGNTLSVDEWVMYPTKISASNGITLLIGVVTSAVPNIIVQPYLYNAYDWGWKKYTEPQKKRKVGTDRLIRLDYTMMDEDMYFLIREAIEGEEEDE
jgi:hypothetical protein